MNSCEYYQELISRMLDDELNNDERSVLAEHLYMCDECAAVYSAFSMVSDMVATDLVEPPEELAEDVMAHIRRAEIRKRNRKNTRATKNAIAAAACVAFIVASVGGVAVVRNHRNANVVYESRLSQNQAAAGSAKEGSYDTVIVSEAPVTRESSAQYVAPVENYTAPAESYTAPAQTEEKSSFFASIFPESWFAVSTPAPTQPPVYATPAATPFAQNPLPPQTNAQANSAMPPVVVVNPTETPQAFVLVDTPMVTEAPVGETPAVTELPTVELPIVTEAPATELPVVTETPVVTEAPVFEVPVTTETPVFEVPVTTEAPVFEAPVVTEAPILEAPVVTEIPVTELPAVTEAPVTELPAVEEGFVMDAPLMELPALDSSIEEIPAIEENPAESETAPVVSNHDFSMSDCSEFIAALFSSKIEEPVEAAVDMSAETGEISTEAVVEYAFYIDRLLAENDLELKALPENVEADRIEMLSFAPEGQFFTVQVGIYGEDVYVSGYTGDGNPVSFLSGLTVAEYDSMLQSCYEINLIG